MAVLSALASGESFSACSRTRVSPTFVPDLCHATLDLLVDGEKGLWHLANEGDVSWHEFACRLAEAAGFDRGAIVAEDRSRDTATVLTNRRGIMLRGLDEAIADYARDVADALAPEAQIAAE